MASLENFFLYVLGHPIILGIATVLVAVLLGYQDMLRFRMRRVNAIAGVCFAESIRRRVLWITPLAILGVVVVSFLQKSLDEQDAIRQTTKYCLFAAGMIVTIAAIILACTNLPKEIENRVIFTIVTKPATRLEIVLGKVLGFAAVSAVILLIMGLFTWAYLQARSASMLSHVRSELATGDLSPGMKSTYAHYASAGLLSVKSLELPVDLQMSSRVPVEGPVRWMGGRSFQYLTVPFGLSEDDKQAILSLFDLSKGPPGAVAIRVKMPLQRHEANADEKAELKEDSSPREGGPKALINGPPLPGNAPAKEAPLIPQITVQILNDNESDKNNLGKSLGGKEMDLQKRYPKITSESKSSDDLDLLIPIPPDVLSAMIDAGKFRIEVHGVTPTIEYGVDANSVQLLLAHDQKLIGTINPSSREPGKGPEAKILSPIGHTGMVVRGQPGGGSVGIFRFDNAYVPTDPASKLALQVRVMLDRSGDLDATQNVASEISVQVRNRSTGKETQPVTIAPETGRASFVDVPQDVIAGGNFDVFVRGLTPGQNVSLQGPTANTPSITLATADNSFSFNLFKSLLMLWLLAVLAVTISVFCSTFLSWPIAVVLTLVLLLARWGVDELGDSLSIGSFRSIPRDIFGLRDPEREPAIAQSLEVLTTILKDGVQILPNVAQFPAFEDIERGVNIDNQKLRDAAIETFGYGIPILLLTYLILKRKEVAP